MKFILSTALAVLFPLSSAFAANSAETQREFGALSFDSILGRLVSDYSAGLQAPAVQEPAQPATAAQEDRFWVTVYASNSRERTRLLEAGMDIVEIKGNRVSGIMHRESMPEVASKGLIVASRVPLSEHIRAAKDFPAADAAYHNYRETTDLLRSLASANSDIASLFSIGKTVEGREIWCLRVNSAARGTAASSKPGAFYLGNHHAREHLSNEVPLLFAVWLMDNRNTAEVKRYIDTLDIYIIPMSNPDGAEYDIKTGRYQWHRKNTRVNSDRSIGVDLNRNYAAWFGGAGTSHYPGSDTYCGPSAFSEPESQAIKRFIEARRNIKTMISYHSYASTILYPYGGSEDEVPNAADRAALVRIAGRMGSLTGYRPEKSSDMYVATGDTCDWAYDVNRILAFTFELEGNSFYPGAGIIDRAVRSNIKAASYLLSVTANPYQ